MAFLVGPLEAFAQASPGFKLTVLHVGHFAGEKVVQLMGLHESQDMGGQAPGDAVGFLTQDHQA